MLNLFRKINRVSQQNHNFLSDEAISKINFNNNWQRFQSSYGSPLLIISSLQGLTLEKTRRSLPDSDWARIGEKALNQFVQREIKNYIEQRLSEANINARVEIKPFSGYFEVRVINPIQADYETELKICELFGITEDAFPDKLLELLILSEEDLKSLE